MGDRRGPRLLLARPATPNFASPGRGGGLEARDSAGSSQGRTEHALGECVRGCGLWALRSPQPLPPGSLAELGGGIAGRRPSPRGGGHRWTSLVPWTRAPARRIPLPQGSEATVSLHFPPHWPVAEPILCAQVGESPGLAHTRNVIPSRLLRGLSTHLPSLAARL
uniref:Uncharacterized protein n=1 Tax=Rousettus aegyptiacus TaxID=9407 RepID=A0A7J8JG41_ROUAE|nr:hypothetical protein HJG63_010189 [Rousettus aegyptiacus]